MKIAMIGSRNLQVDLEGYIPPECTTIVSGGAKGIDACAADFARAKGLALIECLPDHDRHGRGALLQRNLEIIKAADLMFAFWDGKSKGTKHSVDNCIKAGKRVRLSNGTAPLSCKRSSECHPCGPHHDERKF